MSTKEVLGATSLRCNPLPRRGTTFYKGKGGKRLQGVAVAKSDTLSDLCKRYGLLLASREVGSGEWRGYKGIGIAVVRSGVDSGET